MDENDIHYSKCPNCGNYFAPEQDDSKNRISIFCSDLCSIYYQACISCGNYFQGLKTDKTPYCSDYCRVTPKEPDLQNPRKVDQESLPKTAEGVS